MGPCLRRDDAVPSCNQLGLPCSACCRSMFCRYKPTKSTGSSISGGKPPARRGRRPKASNSEYTPENNSEEAYVLESEYERIEYDTGISCKKPATASEDGFSLDRFDDFDEELNFDR